MTLPTSDDAIRERTGRGWEEWFDLLDEAAAERPHREIARWVAGRLDIHPLAWNAQAVTAGYERTRGLRLRGGVNDSTATATKTVAVPVDRLYDAFVDEPLRASWLPDGELRERTATKPKSARFDWRRREPRPRRLRGQGRGQEHRGAPARATRRDPETERMKTFWRERVATLKEVRDERHHSSWNRDRSRERPGPGAEFYVDELGFEKRLDAHFAPGQRWIEVAGRRRGPRSPRACPGGRRGRDRGESRPKTPTPTTPSWRPRAWRPTRR